MNMTAARDACRPPVHLHHAARTSRAQGPEPRHAAAEPTAHADSSDDGNEGNESCASTEQTHTLAQNASDSPADQAIHSGNASPADEQQQQPTSPPSQQAVQPPNSPPTTEQHTLAQPEQQPLLQPPPSDRVTPKQSVQVFTDPHRTHPLPVPQSKPPVIDHDDKENIPPTWMQCALQSKPEEKSNKPYKSKKLAVPLAEAGVQKKRDQPRSPLRDITSAVVGNRRPNLFALRRSPRKKHLTLRYLR